MRICWFRTHSSLEVDFPALKFHGVWGHFPGCNSEVGNLGLSIIPPWEWVPPVWFDNPPPLWKRGTSIDEFCGSRLTSHFTVALYFLECQVSILEKRMPNSLNCWRSWGSSSRAGSRSKNVSWSTHNIPCIVRQSRIAATHGSGTRNSRSWLGTWVAPELLADSGSSNSLASDKKFTLFCESWIRVNNLHTVVGFLSWCTENSSILACRARFLQFLCNFSWFSRKSLFLISPIDLLDVAEIVQIQILDWSHEEQYQDFSFPNVWPPRLPPLRKIFAESFSLLERPIQLSVQGFCGDLPVPQCLHNVLVSISLLLWQDPKRLETTVYDPCMSGQVSLMLVRLAKES